jgi:hypothetical protein
MFDIYKTAVNAARRVVATDIKQPGLMSEDIMDGACRLLWSDFMKRQEGDPDDH